MATNTEPYGLTPLTTEGLANLGHPLSLSDFNQDAQGRYWRTIRGEKTYYPREWFDANGTFTGTGSQPGDKGGQGDSDFFHTGTTWDWTKGEWHNPINWANVIGLSAAGGVGAGIAAPAIGAALGGGSAGGAGTGGLTSGLTSGLGTNATVGSVLGNPLVQGGIKTGLDAVKGNLSWKDALNFVPAIPGVGNIGGAITSNPIAKGAINAGVQSGLNSAKTGTFDPKATAFNIATGAVPGIASSVTDNPITRRALTAGADVGLNTAKTGTFNPVQASVAAGNVLMPKTSGTSQTGSGMPTITRKLVDSAGGGGGLSLGLDALTPSGFSGFEDNSGDPTDPNDPSYTGGWPSNDNVGPPADVNPGEPLPSTPTPGLGLPPPSGTPSGDVPGQLPSRPTPGAGQGLPLPGGGTSGNPSAGLPPAGTTPPATSTGGGFLDDLTKLLSSPVGGLLGGFLSGLGQSLTQQRRQSFSGTAADPVAVMGDLGTGLKGLISHFQDRVNQGVSLPDAYVDLSHSPVFTGGGTAIPVGIVPRDVSVGHPATMTPSAGIVPKTATDAGVSTQTPGVNVPGTTPGTEYALNDPNNPAMTDKQRALAALGMLGVS
jgi:hypothetical protein